MATYIMLASFTDQGIRKVKDSHRLASSLFESMLFAPVLYSLRTDSPIRANDAINGMTLKQLRAGIL